MLATAAGGYQTIGMLLTTPAWARVADCPQRMRQFAAAGVYADDFWCSPAKPQDFADYVFAVVERYDGDGFADAPGSPRVAAWQIGNEPNAWETWPGTPAEYGALLVAGYAAAKAADPTAIVATGGVYVFDGSWNSGIGHRDGLSFLNADSTFGLRMGLRRCDELEALTPYPRSQQWERGNSDARLVNGWEPDSVALQTPLLGAGELRCEAGLC